MYWSGPWASAACASSARFARYLRRSAAFKSFQLSTSIAALHVACSSGIVWTAIAGTDVSFCCSVTMVARLIANPASIVCDACLKVAHFVSVYASFERKMDCRERSWMQWVCDAPRLWWPMVNNQISWTNGKVSSRQPLKRQGCGGHKCWGRKKPELGCT